MRVKTQAKRLGRARPGMCEAAGERIGRSFFGGKGITEWRGQRNMGGSEEETVVTVKCTFPLAFNFRRAFPAMAFGASDRYRSGG